MTLTRTLALTSLVLAGTTPLPAARAQDPRGARLAAAATVRPADLPGEEKRLFASLEANGGRLSAEDVQGATERLYYLFGSAAQAQYRSTGRLFPAHDTLGMAALLARGTPLRLVGTDLVARALAGGRPAATPATLRGGTMALSFAAPEYTVRSRRGWSVRFPYYVMIGGAQTGTPSNGVETETLFLSTLFAAHEGIPGQSQATILVNAAAGADSAAFVKFWLNAFGLTDADRVAAAGASSPPPPLAGATVYRGFSPEQHMHKEIVAVTRGRLTFVFCYLGLPGTYEKNRAEFLALLRTLAVSAPPR